ncbi:MAG: nitrophenyl compound nitroreductase subunit ArsF family protein [Bacteroidales bacterium]
MSRILKYLSVLALLCQVQAVFAQNPTTVQTTPKLVICYFHPNERCPIDQSIEEATRKLMRTDFAKEIKNGVIKLQVLNTDDKANAKTVAKFEMNAQALYLVTNVKGKEVKNDLTEFAFSNSLNNPAKFKAGLREEILRAIK